MRSRTTALIITGTLVTGVGAGYVGGAAASPTTGASPSESRKMDGASDPMMVTMMGAEHAKMMRDPDMRRLEKRAMREFPEMADMMRKHMGG